ncbi:Blp family class II bacteriocin [Streptococcus merionis]|uniref:Blp family class II bacteriocin n=1 Tax=Streptococcus merionis TaxID=400065 RepID=UPI0035160EF7
MNTKTMEQFEVLNVTELATVEGGKYTGSDCVGAVAGGAALGAAGGFATGLPMLGLTALPGAFVGAHFGAIAGGLTCVGGMIGNKFGG